MVVPDRSQSIASNVSKSITRAHSAKPPSLPSPKSSPQACSKQPGAITRPQKLILTPPKNKPGIPDRSPVTPISPSGGLPTPKSLSSGHGQTPRRQKTAGSVEVTRTESSLGSVPGPSPGPSSRKRSKVPSAATQPKKKAVNTPSVRTGRIRKPTRPATPTNRLIKGRSTPPESSSPTLSQHLRRQETAISAETTSSPNTSLPTNSASPTSPQQPYQKTTKNVETIANPPVPTINITKPPTPESPINRTAPGVDLRFQAAESEPLYALSQEAIGVDILERLLVSINDADSDEDEDDSSETTSKDSNHHTICHGNTYTHRHPHAGSVIWELTPDASSSPTPYTLSPSLESHNGETTCKNCRAHIRQHLPPNSTRLPSLETFTSTPKTTSTTTPPSTTPFRRRSDRKASAAPQTPSRPSIPSNHSSRESTLPLAPSASDSPSHHRLGSSTYHSPSYPLRPHPLTRRETKLQHRYATHHAHLSSLLQQQIRATLTYSERCELDCDKMAKARERNTQRRMVKNRERREREKVENGGWREEDVPRKKWGRGMWGSKPAQQRCLMASLEKHPPPPAPSPFPPSPPTTTTTSPPQPPSTSNAQANKTRRNRLFSQIAQYAKMMQPQ